MKRTREQIKAALLQKAEAEIERLLDWEAQTDKPTLTQMENAVLASRKAVGEEMVQALLSGQEERDRLDPPACPGCGQPTQDKGYQAHQVETRVGSVQIQRRYYYCGHCQAGFFPPG